MTYNREDEIKKRIADKDLNIRVSWAINNATEIASAFASRESETENVKNGIRKWTDWYLELYEEVRHREAEKIIDKQDGEKSL